METILHITNGSSTVTLMEKAAISGDYLSWDDILHEGPVPAELTPTNLSETRARFIANCGWLDFPAALARFRERDTILGSYQMYDEVVLWFEHDLYDQLQLLQVLDWFNTVDISPIHLTLVQSDNHLGMRPAEDYPMLLRHRQAVSTAQLTLAQRAWAAFRQPTPREWRDLLDQNIAALPYLSSILRRHLQQYPAPGSGLNRTERQILQAVVDGAATAGDIFRLAEALEEARFMGDWTFWEYLNRMLSSDPPLLRAPGRPGFLIDPQRDDFEQYREPLQTGQVVNAVLSGARDWTNIAPVDRWLGGVHVHPGNMWRWNDAAGALQAP